MKESHAMNIAVIGAGIAGISVARSLVESGQDVTVLEKSRGVGGRLATRRSGAFSFDHGAQFIRARDPGFQAVLNDARIAGYAGMWSTDRHVGMPGMSAFPGYLSNGLTILTETKVARLECAGGRWWLFDAAGATLGVNNDGFDAVLLATPAPQARAILAESGLALEGLEFPVYAPSWALMLGYRQATGFVPSELTLNGPTLGWIARNNSKPGRPPLPETFVVHATAEWSFDNLAWEADRAADALHQTFRAETGIEAPPDLIVAHRWRYAFVSRALGRPCLWNEHLRLGACGDWALGPRVEAAFLSAKALAAAVLGDPA